jgi:hypothetical protein
MYDMLLWASAPKTTGAVAVGNVHRKSGRPAMCPSRVDGAPLLSASPISRSVDWELEHRLGQRVAGVTWSVKNQARLHRRNGDPPYRDCLDAMRA